MNTGPKQRKYRIEHYEQYRKTARIYDRYYYYKTKEEIYVLLGDKCAKCGFVDRRALHIDHIFGGGSGKNSGRNGGFYKRILNDIKSGEKKYQILCANCNSIKRYENNELNERILMP